MRDKKQELEPCMKRLTGSGLRKEYNKAVYCFPVYLYTEHIMWKARLVELQDRIKIAGRNINNLRYADDIPLNGRKWRGTKEPLDEGEGGEWKNQFKIQY